MNDQPEETPDEQPEENEQVHAMFIMGPHGPVTREEYAAHLDRHQAQADASAHQADGFFDDLTEEQLLTFRGILNAVMYGPRRMIPYYQGMASSALKYRFGICPACSKKHDNELEKMVSTGKAEMNVGEEKSVEVQESEEELRANAEVWNVRFDMIEDGRPLHLQPVSCKADCGATWVNLIDRMLRKPGPEGCDGCIYKMKNG